MKQAKRNQQRLERRSRRYEASLSTAKVVARATGHRIVPDCPEYVPLTESQRTFQDSGTWNFARGEGYARR
ncbi:MAG TPA: hypothetical protein VFW40_11390 [Capsulimonadaceae bacterium]|nr:hypothetical protein [Capsulimonadaceae bacterium]